MDNDEKLSNILATGAIMGCLQMVMNKTALYKADVVMENGTATNQIDVEFSFLKSNYRITIERHELPF